MQTLKIGSRGEDVRGLQKKLNLYPDGIFGKLTDEGVRQFQKAHNLTVDGIVGPKTWEALGVEPKNPRKITEIIVHCSATPEGKDFTVDDIRRWHTVDRGWSDVGYHQIIYRDGTVHPGRDEKIAGAHCLGHNQNSIGVCYIGGMDKDNKNPKDTRTPEQRTALIELLTQLKERYPGAVIHSHSDYAAKACPSFSATSEYKYI